MTILIIFSCGQNYGRKLKYDWGELYYTSSVTESEANDLGRYLGQRGFNTKMAQIDKTGSTYEFRATIKKGLENDQECIQSAKRFGKELSINVFGGNPVDMHLCDEKLKTIRVVVGS